MPFAKYIPLDAIVPAWPEHLFSAPGPGAVAIVGYEVVEHGSAVTAWVDLAVAGGLTITPTGLEGFELVLPGGPSNPLRCSASLAGTFEARIDGFDVILRIQSPVIVPVEWQPPTWVPKTLPTGEPAAFELSLNVGALVIDEDLQPRFELDGSVTLDPFMIGDTGIVVEATGVRPVLSANEPPPAGQAPGFRGLAIEAATIHLPDGFDLSGITPDTITLTGLAIGNGGISGSIGGFWNPVWTGNTPSGDGAGTLLGIPFGLRSLGLTLVQNAVAGAQLTGDLVIPFFEARVAVTVAIGADGAFLVEIAAPNPADADALRLQVPGICTFELTALGVARDEQGTALLLSGRLTPEAGAPGLQWPTIDVQDLRITPDGRAEIPGGWLTLQEPLALDLFGFGMEITRVGFGTEADGRRWIGVDGGIRFLEFLPAGASARGLRAIWDPAAANPIPQIALDGIGVTFGVPDAFAFEGAVALMEDPASGARLFTGALALGLDALDVGVDAGITIGRDATSTYVFVHLGVNVPIPIAATGAALYGAQGLFAMNMSPVVTNGGWPANAAPPAVAKGDWYGWYKRVPAEFEVTDPAKWAPDIGAWAFGAGLSIGTLPDAGFSVNTNALLVVLLPGPVLLLQGTADIFKPPKALGGADQEGTLSMLAALDGRAGTLQLGIDAAWSLASLIGIAASTEAFFDFDRSDAWHLWIGQKTPESARIRADYLALWHADAWLMVDPKGIDTGLGVSWGDSWKFGPARITLSSWIGGAATISRRPPQLGGRLSIGGEASVAAGPFDVGIGVEAALEGASFAPYHVAGTLDVRVGLPFPMKDLDVAIALEWTQPDEPELEDPWAGALVEHERCTESWTPLPGGAVTGDPAGNAPIVPLDANVVLTFAKPMADPSAVADNPPSAAPSEAIGDYAAAFSLVSLRLHRQRRTHPAAGWEDVSDTVFGSWTPDADGAGTRLQLYARNPFAFTRNTSRRWTDAFLAGAGAWPCEPAAELETTCVSWYERPLGTTVPALWTERGATFTTGASIAVVETENEHVLRLGPQMVGGEARPGALWVALPEPCVAVHATVWIPVGDWLVMRAWSNGEPVGLDTRLPGPDQGELRIVAARIDAVTFAWSAHGESELSLLCWTTLASAVAHAAWERHRSGLETAATRWESCEPVLDPDSHYLLEVTTRALLTKGDDEIQRVEATHTVQFQTGGPPGIVPEWAPPPVAAPPPDPPPPVPPPAPVGAFPHGGVLKDLAPYVRWTIPAAGAAPVFRAYDLGCEFDATHVQQMYGADMRVRVRDGNGQPVLDAGGTELLVENAWEEAPATTVTTGESAWLSRLDACTGALSWTELRGDDRVTTGAAGLLYDDFSGSAAVTWTPLVLDPDESREAHWHLDAGVLRQDVDIAGGVAGSASAEKPGTVYIATGVDQADVALETRAWSDAGAFGLVFRWQGRGDYYRFSVGLDRFRLARVRGGIVRQLWSSREGFAPGVPSRLVVQVEGTRIRCQVDDRLVCDLRDDAADAPGSGSVGLYTWRTDSAAFDEVRARPWPGGALAPARVHVAELEATRPLFTDAFDNLDAFDQQTLGTREAVTGSTAAAGVATIARRRASDAIVVALAGDSDAGDYSVECNAQPGAEGAFGLVVRHDGGGRHVALVLTPGVGRALVAQWAAGSGLGASAVLWDDPRPVAVGQVYALSVECSGETVTIGIDGERFTASLPGSAAPAGRFGLLSGVPLPSGCAFTDLVVRSSPPVAVHRWPFTTSRFLGLPDLLDGFAGRTWPVEGAGPDRASLADAAGDAAAAMTRAQGEVETARATLADAVEEGDIVELEPLRAAAVAAATARDTEAAAAYDAVVGALRIPWRPLPPVVEVSTVADAAEVFALLLELPEPLPWARVTWTLAGPAGSGGSVSGGDVVLCWSADDSRAVLVRTDGTAFATGAWTLNLALHLDVGAERAVWRRAGSTAPEVGALQVVLRA